MSNIIFILDYMVVIETNTIGSAFL